MAKKTNPIDIRKILRIDFSDLTTDLSESLMLYGYYGELNANIWGKVRRARQNREIIAASFYMISKDDVLDTGRPPSDKFIDMELQQDEDWVEAQEEYHTAKIQAEKSQVLVKGLEYKLDSLRTLLASERVDKVHHLKSE
jgi:hypothetical protein